MSAVPNNAANVSDSEKVEEWELEFCEIELLEESCRIKFPSLGITRWRNILTMNANTLAEIVATSRQLVPADFTVITMLRPDIYYQLVLARRRGYQTVPFPRDPYSCIDEDTRQLIKGIKKANPTKWAKVEKRGKGLRKKYWDLTGNQ